MLLSQRGDKVKQQKENIITSPELDITLELTICIIYILLIMPCLMAMALT
jgi:hypothetical protein